MLRKAAAGLLLACSAFVQDTRPSLPVLEATFANVRAGFSGEAAREVVGFVEQYWRVPGNVGFNESIGRVVEVLQAAGYRPEGAPGSAARLTYRVERRPMSRPTWEPVGASLEIVGQDRPLLEFTSNRNMLTIYSYSTPVGGIEAEVVDVGEGRAEDFAGVDVGGKIVYGAASTARLFRDAVQARGAVGVLSHGIPAFNQPQRYQDAISFGSIPLDSTRRGFGIRLSFAARQELERAFAAGPVRVRVTVNTRIYESEELTLVAEVHGRTHPDERFVFSAHVQEPGANDNASGVGVLAEIARVLAREVDAGRFDPARTITMLWGDEISSTRRYLEEDSTRTAGVRWGLSLDMVGEDTDKTGGTFLIEKMPDPSAVWTRGEDRHTEWGGRPLTVGQLTPHYFNDFVLNRCLDQAVETGWVVKTNPYEGGSDHVPFLRAGKPGLLLWHFTDAFYHTDLDRLDKVSGRTLKNVGVCAAVSAMALTAADGQVARFVIDETERAAVTRLEAEAALSGEAVAGGADVDEQRVILRTWTEWYAAAVRAAADIEVGGSSRETRSALDAAAARIGRLGDQLTASVARSNRLSR